MMILPISVHDEFELSAIIYYKYYTVQIYHKEAIVTVQLEK